MNKDISIDIKFNEKVTSKDSPRQVLKKVALSNPKAIFLCSIDKKVDKKGDSIISVFMSADLSDIEIDILKKIIDISINDFLSKKAGLLQ